MRLFQEMAMRGLAPDSITISTLVDAHCNAGLIEQALLRLYLGFTSAISRLTSALPRLYLG